MCIPPLPDKGQHAVRHTEHQVVQHLRADSGPDIVGVNAPERWWRHLVDLFFEYCPQKNTIGDSSMLFSGHLSFVRNSGKCDWHHSCVLRALCTTMSCWKMIVVDMPGKSFTSLRGPFFFRRAIVDTAVLMVTWLFTSRAACTFHD